MAIESTLSTHRIRNLKKRQLVAGDALVSRLEHGPASQSRLEPCWDEIAIGELIQTDTVEIKLLWFTLVYYFVIFCLISRPSQLFFCWDVFKSLLVGGLEYFLFFHIYIYIYWECHHPNRLS